jgi:CHAT domain-containing protein
VDVQDGDKHQSPLDSETLAAYVDGRLDAASAARVEAILATDPEWYQVFAESVRARAALSPDATIARFPKRQAMYGAIAASLAAAAAAFVWVWLGPASRDAAARPELTQLVAAVGPRRPFEPRLTGGFGYGPLASPVRSGDPSAVPLEIREAALALERAARETPSASTIAARGASKLFLGEPNEAVRDLETAVQMAPVDARLHSDLAAAYLLRASQLQSADDLQRALSTADQAARLAPSLPEAVFNKALALQALHLREQEQTAWEQYLTIDAASPWAAEVRRRLDLLRGKGFLDVDQERRRLLASLEQTAGDLDAQIGNVQVARELLEEHLLAEWGRRTLAHDIAGAARIHDQARRLSVVLERRQRDPLPRHAVALLSTCEARATCVDLAEGHIAYEAGRNLYEADRLQESAREMAKATAHLAAAGSPVAHWAQLHLGIDHYYGRRYSEAAILFEALRDQAARLGYANVEGRCHWMLGLIHNVQSRVSAALEEYAAALRVLEIVGEPANIAAVHSLTAEAYDYAGDVRAAWDHRLASLAQSEGLTGRRRYTILTSCGYSALRDRLPAAALFFQAEALAAAARWGRIPALVEAHFQRARTHQRNGSRDAALADLQTARTLVSKAEGDFRTRAEAEVALLEAEIFVATDPAAAAAAATRALQYFEGAKAYGRVATAKLALGRARRAAGDMTQAATALREAVEVFEAQRNSLSEERLRISALDEGWPFYSEWLEVELQRGDSDGAWAVADRSRARTLVETISHGQPLPAAAISQIQNAIGPDRAALYYSALERELLIWTIDSREARLSRAPVGRADLGRLIRRFLEGVGDARSASATDTQLYDVLVRPARAAIAKAKTILVLPDGDLFTLPFALLRDPDTGLLLAETHALQMVPSGTFLSLARAPDGGGKPAAILAVGANAAAVIQRPRGIAPLDHADEEAAAVARSYPTRQVLTGPAATASRVKQLAERSQIVHFAGHAVANAAYPLRSFLLVAPDDGDASGQLMAWDIARLRLSQTRLVILGACSTGAGPSFTGEGVITLARAFLAAGAHGVIASLWDVEDKETLTLMTSLHQEIARGEPPAVALRKAQLAYRLTAGARSEKQWAAFVYIGA